MYEPVYQNCSVRELAFGLPLKKSKSFKRLPVVWNSLGFKHLNDLEKQLLYYETLPSCVCCLQSCRHIITTNKRALSYSHVKIYTDVLAWLKIVRTSGLLI